MDKLHSIWLFLRRQKYIVVTVIFFLLIGFAGDSSLWQRFQNYRRMRLLEHEIKRYAEEYENDTKQLNLLKENPDHMERIARERYLMKKTNEDIFVFEEDLPKTPTVLMEQITVESIAPSGEQNPETALSDSLSHSTVRDHALLPANAATLN